MVTVFLNNGNTVEIHAGVKVSAETIPGTGVAAFTCHDADGTVVGRFRLTETAGYSITEESPLVRSV